MKKAQTKANTIIQKSKIVHLHSKFIQWTNYVLWVDFSTVILVQMALGHLLLNEIFFWKSGCSIAVEYKPHN